MSRKLGAIQSTVTLGHDKFPARWPSEKLKDFRKAGIELGRRYPARKVQAAVLKAHPLLISWPECNLTCFELMYLESEAIVRTMLRLMREDGVVSLSVHDSLIVPKRQLDHTRKILCGEYERAVDAVPRLEVNEPANFQNGC